MRQFLLKAPVSRVNLRKLHPYRQILPLNKAGRNMVRVGIALPNLGYNPRDAWWGTPCVGRVELPVVAKHFRELREIHKDTTCSPLACSLHL